MHISEDTKDRSNIQAGLLLCQGCVPDRCRTYQTQNTLLTTVYFLWSEIDSFILYSVWQLQCRQKQLPHSL